jgi:hypothetical protein
MNALNALIFAALGSFMEILPKAFPWWFPPTGADGASARGLWLMLMGAVQILIGVGFIVRAYVVPFVHGILTVIPAESGTLALPNPRGVTTR